MKDFELGMDEIKELVDLVSEKDVSSIKIEYDDFKLEIKGKKSSEIGLSIPQVSKPCSLSIDETGAAQIAGATAEEKPAAPTGNVVTSPIVGTFYQSPAPDKPAFVELGSTVSKGDTLFIIESMKLMNEVTSEYSGVVTAFHVKDGEPVEFGQPILTIE